MLSGIKAPAACEVFTDAERTAPYDRERGHEPMNLTSLDASEDAGGWRLCRLTSSAPGDPGGGEGNDLDTWGMPDCQSGTALPWAAAPVPVSLRMATNRICQADCHEESCGNAL